MTTLVIVIVLVTLLTDLLVIGVRLNAGGQCHNRKQTQKGAERTETRQEPFLKNLQNVSIPTVLLWYQQPQNPSPAVGSDGLRSAKGLPAAGGNHPWACRP